MSKYSANVEIPRPTAPLGPSPQKLKGTTHGFAAAKTPTKTRAGGVSALSRPLITTVPREEETGTEKNKPRRTSASKSSKSDNKKAGLIPSRGDPATHKPRQADVGGASGGVRPTGA